MEPKSIGENRNEDGTFAIGNPGGPGRPKGSTSIKDKVRQYLNEHPEEMDAIVEHFVKNNRELMWQMLEGRPQQDLTSKGEQLIPQPIYGGNAIQGYNGNPKNLPAPETN